MKRWLFHLLATWTFCIFSPALVSGQGSSPYPDLDKVILQMTQTYSLTSDQVIQIRAVYMECQNKTMPYRQNLSPDNRTIIGQMRKEREDKVFKLLNAEQQTLFNISLARKEEMRSMAEKRKPKN